jgi:peroxiredoxin
MNSNTRTPIRMAILGVILLALVYAIYTSVTAEEKISARDQSPDFSLQSLQQKETVTLSDLKGKGVILNFWGSWCGPCLNEMPALEKQYQKWKDKGLVILGINIGETPVSVNNFVKEVGVTFPILLDRKREVTKLYHIGRIPASYFISPQGEIVEIFEGQMSESFIEERVKKILP